MTFTEIYDFIENRMRMSHIYQPVMLMTLLKNKGMASVTKIAESLLMYDHAQVEYYENITKNMVGRVLRNHKIVSKEGKNFVLSGFKSLTESQIEELNLLCQEKLNDHQ
ncbi:MAG: HIT family hydrolase, partial [SAR324 cluster bacterium]|nr:HIT family hydrolase [SAR324 cluster bacterium]